MLNYNPHDFKLYYQFYKIINLFIFFFNNINYNIINELLIFKKPIICFFNLNNNYLKYNITYFLPFSNNILCKLFLLKLILKLKFYNKDI